MRTLFRVGAQLARIGVCLLLFAACEPDTKNESLHTTDLPSATVTDIPASPSAAPTRTPYLAPQPSLASYIMGIIPPPGSILNIQDFRDGRHADMQGDWPTGKSVHPSVCVELNALGLLEPGDALTDADLLLERVEFIVDNQVLPRPEVIEDLITLSWLLDDDGNEIAVAGGPYVFCWKIDLNAGTHTSYLKVHKTSGQILEYRWSFTLTDD